MKVMGWGQEAYQKMEKSGWTTTELTPENIQNAIATLQHILQWSIKTELL